MTGDRMSLTAPILWGTLVGAILNTTLCCCCCCFFIVPGLVAGVLVARDAARLGFVADASQGALAGLAAGGLSGVVKFLLFAVFLVFGEMFGMKSGAEQWNQIPPIDNPSVQQLVNSFRDWSIWVESLSLPMKLLMQLFETVGVGALLGSVGGAVGLVLARGRLSSGGNSGVGSQPAPEFPPLPPPPPPAPPQ